MADACRTLRGMSEKREKVRSTLWLFEDQLRELKQTALDIDSPSVSDLCRRAVDIAKAHGWAMPESAHVTERIGGQVKQR